MGKFMTSKFASVCNQTGKQIQKGDHIYYVPGRGAFCEESKAYQDQRENGQTAAHVKANEEAYFDDFVAKNKL